MSRLLFFEGKDYIYVLYHPLYKDSIVYLKGRVHPDVFPSMISYIQFCMNELHEGIMLFPQDLKRILCKFYRFVPLEAEEAQQQECIKVDVRERVEELKVIEECILLLPFYQKGLLSELKLISEELLHHFNMKSE